ncbi:MAG TPA: iron chelate uptake ABC transporter family permease subunit, partial [Myxococcota bacterium]|nr:iron chelate uptake ABC transporter family permease subunit [Myxococcota bacterium]
MAFAVAVYGAAALAAVVLSPLVGPTRIDLGRAFDSTIPFAENPDAQILFVARLPRTLAGALVGSALATAGVV